MTWYRRRKNGYALATILILLGVCMFGAAALVTVSVLESKISRSETEGTIAYYAAEAGVTDAIWRINNTPALSSALVAGNLSNTYVATDQPAAGQSFTVTMTTASQGAGYGLIDVVGTSNNGSFVAQRHVQATVFQGVVYQPVTGSNAFLGGGSLSITNGSSAVNIVNGDMFAVGDITINQATVNGLGHTINSMGNYSQNSGSTVNVDAIHAVNYPPAPTGITVPGYDFTQYNSLPSGKCTTALYASQTQLLCTPAQFQSLIGSSTNFSFPNQVVYVNGNLTFNNWVKNKTITMNGLFVVGGGLSITGAASNFTFKVVDPGSNKCGIVVKSNVNNSNGTWNVQGPFYASGSISFTDSQSIKVDGGVIAGGAVNINTGISFDMIFNPNRVGVVLGGVSSTTAVQVLHWEEEY